MCFVPTKGKSGDHDRHWARRKLIQTKTVTAANKAEIAKALGIAASKLITGKKLHIAHE